jgi:hypothetical protein
MRGELDDALARMARREELLRRRSAQPTEGSRAPADGTRSPAGEVAEAVRRVVAHHPGLTVSLTVDNGTARAAIRVGWSEGMVSIAPATEPAAPVSAPAPPAWPLAVKTVPPWAAVTDEQSAASAARLAELIRRDPTLLGGVEDQP